MSFTLIFNKMRLFLEQYWNSKGVYLIYSKWVYLTYPALRQVLRDCSNSDLFWSKNTALFDFQGVTVDLWGITVLIFSFP